MELTPHKILVNIQNKDIDKLVAVENLISLIENSNFIRVRLDSIDILGQIDVKNKKIFDLLENLLVSDSNESIRNAAANLLKDHYLDKALSPMKWALQHDESPYALNTIFEALITIIKNLEKSSDRTSRLDLIEEVNKIDEKEIKIGFEILKETKTIEDISNKDLVDILINYYTLSFLKKTFWRLKHVIENSKIVELDFIFKGLTSLPDAIKYLSSLKTLILRYNQLIKLPDWIGSLKDLKCLNLNVNNLTKLPESIGKLNSLKELLLWKNELSTLPESIGSVLSLEVLNLRLNRLEALPSSIGNLSSLKELNLHDNKLSYVPRSIGSLSSLENLNLSWNELTAIPESLGSIKTLKNLDLGRNELSIIPDSISALSNLETLNLSENRIRIIPKSIGSMSSLQVLNLSRNRLSEIPESLGSLTNLKELYLAENNYVKIPKSIKLLKENDLKLFI